MGLPSAIKYKAKVDFRLRTDATMMQQQTSRTLTQKVSSHALPITRSLTQNRTTPFLLQFQLQVIEEFLK